MTPDTILTIEELRAKKQAGKILNKSQKQRLQKDDESQYRLTGGSAVSNIGEAAGTALHGLVEEKRKSCEKPEELRVNLQVDRLIQRQLKRKEMRHQTRSLFLAMERVVK
ncbi:MAG: hypothetical protein L6R41_006311 [Letrouitia leprolyta]|nr:MAG: hypothetical protein L6R41_006311 [Letrouitia leprolyta]